MYKNNFCDKGVIYFQPHEKYIHEFPGLSNTCSYIYNNKNNNNNNLFKPPKRRTCDTVIFTDNDFIIQVELKSS